MTNPFDQVLADEANEIDVYQRVKKEFEKRIRVNSRVKLSVERSLRDNQHCIVQIWEDSYNAGIEILLIEIDKKEYVNYWALRLVEALTRVKYLIPQ